jgi:hypothetical protein
MKQYKNFTSPPLCMPDKYKYEECFKEEGYCEDCEGDCICNYEKENKVQAYRDYYIGEKSKFAKWKLGNVPEWYINGLKLKNIKK